MNWARQQCHWMREQWNRVVFTDESKFNLHGPDGRMRVWRRQVERLDPANVMEYDRYGGGFVKIWVGISLKTVHGHLNAVRYWADIITPVIVPYIANGKQTFYNKTMHVATPRHTHIVLAANNITRSIGQRIHLIFLRSSTCGITLDLKYVAGTTSTWAFLSELCTRMDTGTSTIHPTSNKQQEAVLYGCYSI